MKKHALALAVLALPGLALADGPTLYGQLNVTLDSLDKESATATEAWQLNSWSSRIGVKGDADTGVQGLKGLYYAEFGIDVDDGTGPFSQRNIYAGLKGGFGTLRAGKIDTPVKDAQGKVDQFNDLSGDIQNLVGGENRSNNIIYYTTPKLADAVTVNLSVAPAEDTNVDGEAGNEDGIADTLSASVVYEQGSVYLALGYDQDQAIGGYSPDGITRGDIVRLVGTLKGDAFEAGLLFTTAETNGAGGLEDQGVLVSGAFKNGNWKVKGQYGVNEGDTTGVEKTITALGVDYALGKSTTTYGYYTAVDTDAATDTTDTTIGVGLLQKF
ncbi:MAG: porin [Pseudomonadota bacterium]